MFCLMNSSVTVEPDAVSLWLFPGLSIQFLFRLSLSGHRQHLFLYWDKARSVKASQKESMLLLVNYVENGGQAWIQCSCDFVKNKRYPDDSFLGLTLSPGWYLKLRRDWKDSGHTGLETVVGLCAVNTNSYCLSTFSIMFIFCAHECNFILRKCSRRLKMRL